MILTLWKGHHSKSQLSRCKAQTDWLNSHSTRWELASGKRDSHTHELTQAGLESITDTWKEKKTCLLVEKSRFYFICDVAEFPLANVQLACRLRTDHHHRGLGHGWTGQVRDSWLTPPGCVGQRNNTLQESALKVVQVWLESAWGSISRQPDY